MRNITAINSVARPKGLGLFCGKIRGQAHVRSHESHIAKN